jgi:hypothetical protein
METCTMHELLIRYRKDGFGIERIMNEVAERLYRDPGRYGFDGEDEAADALLKYGGRIARLADRYVDRGVPFDAYLSTSLRFLSRTIRRDRRRAWERETVCERAEALDRIAGGIAGIPPDLDAGSEPTPCPEAAVTPAAADPSGRPVLGSRLVFLFLKCVWDADDRDAERVAAAAGVDPAWLASAAAQARRSLEAERARFENMQARRNRSWCRLRLLEARLRADLEPYRRSSLEAALARERARFESARVELDGFRPIVPNSIVARILGVPKGTVDSGLYYLRKQRGL